MADTLQTTHRLRSAIPGLDELLGGGFLAGRSILISGPPGCGKSTLALQMLVSGARDQAEPGVLISFEQSPSQIIADAASFGWDLPQLERENVFRLLCVQPTDTLDQPGRQENRLLGQIEDWVLDSGARRIVIDSVSHIQPLLEGEQARASFLSFIDKLKAMSLTPILIAEEDNSPEHASLITYLSDAAVHLEYYENPATRLFTHALRIRKTRGQSHVSGSHPFEIGSSGIVLYPHTYTAEGDGSHEATEFLHSGVAGLDSLLSGGIIPNSAVLAAGLSGTFKTIFAGHFLMAGIADGHAGLWVSSQERADDLERSYGGTNLDLREALQKGRLRILEITPGQHTVEKILFQAEQLIKANNVQRVALDSMTDLLSGVEESSRQEAAQWILHRLRGLGVTTFYTQRLSRAPGRNPLSDIEQAELADTVLYLGLVEIQSRLEKVISPLKHRGASVEGDLRSITFSKQGLEVSERFEGLSGVLSGMAMGRRKARIEGVYQPLYFIRDFLKMAQNPNLSPEKRTQMLETLSAQTDKVIESLADMLDAPGSGKDQADG